MQTVPNKTLPLHLINWGVLPFTTEEEMLFGVGDYIYIPAVRSQLLKGKKDYCVSS